MSGPWWWQPFFGELARWWALVVVLGWLCYPLAFRAGSLLPDRGLLFSKLLGLFLTSFCAVWFAYLGCEGSTALRMAVMLVVFANAVLLSFSWRVMSEALRGRLGQIVGVEAAFLAAFLAFLWMRSYFPDATYDARGWWGAEKWVNLGLLSALWRDFAIPPVDPWLAGEPVNYYYLSHATWAMVARVGRVAPPIAFNTALATVFALVLQTSFGAGWAIARRRRAGWWCVFLVAFAGPLAAWRQAPEVARVFAQGSVGHALRAFDFWAPSDVVNATRNEFPAFNWLLGDLHAHGAGALLLLAGVALLAQLGRALDAEAAPWRSVALRQPAAWLLVGTMALMWVTNGWDLAVLAVLGTVWVVARSVRGALDRGEATAQAAQGLLLGVLAGLAATALLSRFYSIHTQVPLVTHNTVLWQLPGPLGMLGGLGRVGGFQHTRPGEWLLFWGVFAFAGFGLRWFAQGSGRERRGGFWDSVWVARLAWAGVAGGLVVHGGGRAPFVGLFLVVLAVWGLWRLLRFGEELGEGVWWALVLTVGASGVMAFAEFVYVDDPIEAPYDRYNTVFKLWYGSWCLVSLALGAGLASVGVSRRGGDGEEAVVAFDPLGGMDGVSVDGLEDGERMGAGSCGFVGWGRRLGWWAVAGVVLVAGGLYPILGVGSRVAYGKQRMARWIDRGMDSAVARGLCRTLDATAFLAFPDEAPDDLRLGTWMREHLTGPGWLAEDSGESYSMAGRFSVLSGIPCVMGWEGHETQWRGAGFAGREWGARSDILEAIYDSADSMEIRRVCAETGIRWIAVGSMERRVHGAPGLEAVGLAGREVARFGESVLYEVVPPVGSLPDRESRR